MKTLVTGGAGFIGSDLVARLLEAGDEVVVLDSLEPQVPTEPPQIPDGARSVHGDVDDIDALLSVEASARLLGQYRPGDIRHCYADPSLAAEVLGFRATITLEDGMHSLAGWLASQAAVDRVDEATAELVARGLAR